MQKLCINILLQRFLHDCMHFPARSAHSCGFIAQQLWHGWIVSQPTILSSGISPKFRCIIQKDYVPAIQGFYKQSCKQDGLCPDTLEDIFLMSFIPTEGRILYWRSLLKLSIEYLTIS